MGTRTYLQGPNWGLNLYFLLQIYMKLPNYSQLYSSSLAPAPAPAPAPTAGPLAAGPLATAWRDHVRFVLQTNIPEFGLTLGVSETVISLAFDKLLT